MLAFIDGEFRGMAADQSDLATAGVRNMDKFVEVDTGKIYYYNEEDSEWVEFPQQDTLASASQDAEQANTSE